MCLRAGPTVSISIFARCSRASVNPHFSEQETANRRSTHEAEVAAPRLPPYAAAWPLPKIHSDLPSMQSRRKSCWRVRFPYQPISYSSFVLIILASARRGCDLQHKIGVARNVLSYLLFSPNFASPILDPAGYARVRIKILKTTPRKGASDNGVRRPRAHVGP
jgi:hypothetical protein